MGRLRRTLRVSVVLVVGVPLFAGGAASAALAMLLYGDLPGVVPEENARVVSMPSVVTDAEGNEIGTFREFDLTVSVEPTDIPQVLKDAVVAAEDQHFWEHRGLDVEGIARAALENFRAGTLAEGGSTITQQLVKNRYLSGERTIDRKLDEAVLAARLEREMTKEQILFEYLDTTYFGSGAYGAGAAAETYFRKHVSELTPSEAALLAGIIPAPSEANPRSNPWAAEELRQKVLRIMAEQGYLSDAELERELAAQLWFSGLGQPDRPATVYYPPEESEEGPYPFFVDYVRRYMVERYGEERVFRGGLRIETTLDPRLQAQAEAAVEEQLDGTEAPLEMSLVAVEPATGHVKALVGGRDWTQSQVNLALGGSLGMQPGSAFKPFVLATALESGLGPDTTYPAPSSWTVPGCEGSECTISNYGSRGYGSMTLERATWLSVNTVYGELTFDLGVESVAETADRLGVEIEGAADHGISLALGSAEVSPLEMASAYGVFANHGVRAAPTPVLRVVDASGAVLEDNRLSRGERVMNAAVADTVTGVLEGVISYGTGTAASIGRPAAGKTGTAEENRAAWFVGYTPQLATAVWMGYPDEPRPLENIGGYASVTGGTLPALAWARFMSSAHDGLPVEEFPEPGPLPVPGGVVTLSPGPRRFPDSPAMECGGLCDRPPPTEPDPADEGSGDESEPEDEGEEEGRAPDEGGGDTTTTSQPGADDD